MTTTPATPPTTATPTSTEADDLLETLAQQRWFFRFTLQGLTDAQARRRPTVSELHLAGLLAHLTETEARWAQFCVHGRAVFADAPWADADAPTPRGDTGRPDFEPGPDETLTSLLGHYAEVAARTEDVVRSLPDLGVRYELPVTPWWPAGGSWSARRAVLHLIAETAQHSGHADVIRESLDGQQTMG